MTVREVIASDAWAHGVPCALLVALIIAVALGGCANVPKPGSMNPKEFFAEQERWHHSQPARR